MLLIVQRNEICRISLDSPDYTYFVLPLTGIKHAIAIDFDPVDKMLYWTDEQASAIRRAYLDGSGQEDVIVAEVCSINSRFYVNSFFFRNSFFQSYILVSTIVFYNFSRW